MKYSFLIYFYLSSFLICTLALIGLFFPYKYFRFFVLMFANNMTMALKFFCNISIKVNNMPSLNLDGGCIFASKHQSIFETIFYNSLFYHPTFILKKELLSIPVFGYHLKKLKMIAIDRKKGVRSIKEVNEKTEIESKTRPIIIFPEGTRTSFGKYHEVKSGIFSIYKNQIHLMVHLLKT